MKQQVLGKLIGNTGDPNNLSMSLNSPFAGRRGEFVRIRHQERKEEPETDVLGRIVSVSRSNLLYNSGMGDSVNDLELMPGAKISGDSLFARIELIGYKDPANGQIKIPRRPMEPGAKVMTVDYHFLSGFYEFSESTSLHIGNLVGYERGDNIVPIFLDVNKLVTEHLAVLAMTGAGKSYTVGRIIEREGLRVAILPQPNWRDDLRDFKKLGAPRMFFGVTAGCMDSMVNRYTAAKKLRSEDAYTPGGEHGFRPDYASTVYSQILKKIYPDILKPVR